MGWGDAISSVPKIFLKLWDHFAKKRKEKKEALVEAKKKVDEGVEERDPSKITEGFDEANRE